MEYKGYKVFEQDDSIVVENVNDFDPVDIFECGQCFRWLKQPDGSYTGVAMGRVINLAYRDNTLIVKNTNMKDFIEIWFNYLDLGTDYSLIKKKLAKDENMIKAIEFGHGIRLLRQDIWETLISFIISANNRIPMIMKVVASLSDTYGKQIIYDGNSFYTFPDEFTLSQPSVEQLAFCRGGFRCKYIIQSANMVKDGILRLAQLKDMNAGQARNELVKLPGVGNKVADCTLLYSGTKMDVFPTDVWVKRVMEELYFKREASFKEIQAFSSDYFGGLAGYAQQYLFYYAREHKIGAR